MEPLYSVLLYSKYSQNCKKLFDMIGNTGLDLSNTIQLLCIDNEIIRKRIRNNKQIEVTTVPCVLNVFSNGAVEKYDSSHAFAWMENLLQRLAPPPPPPPPPQPVIHVPPVSQKETSEDYEEEMTERKMPKLKVPRRMRPIEKAEATSIDDIPLEEDDRHRNKPQPKRIRQDENNYIEDDDLFSGEMVDNHREPSNVVRNTASRKDPKDLNGLKAKADELAKGRDAMDKEYGSMGNRPVGDRRP